MAAVVGEGPQQQVLDHQQRRAAIGGEGQAKLASQPFGESSLAVLAELVGNVGQEIGAGTTSTAEGHDAAQELRARLHQRFRPRRKLRIQVQLLTEALQQMGQQGLPLAHRANCGARLDGGEQGDGPGQLVLAIGQQLIEELQVGAQLAGLLLAFRTGPRRQPGQTHAVDGGQLKGQGAVAGEGAAAARSGGGTCTGI